MEQPTPYFMKNKEWYYHSEQPNRYMLTDVAPEEARKSYRAYYAVWCGDDRGHEYYYYEENGKQYRIDEDGNIIGKLPKSFKPTWFVE